MYYTVYKTTNLTNGKVYVGCHQTNNPEDEYLGSGSIFSRALKKYGGESFKKEVLFAFDNREEMLTKEREIVTPEFVADPMTYNMVRGGNPNNFGGPNMTPSQSGRLGQEKLKERKLVDSELKARLTQVGYQNLLRYQERGGPHPKSFLGKHHTKETKDKIAAHNTISHKGEGNSQFGKVWVWKENEKPQVIPIIELETLLNLGWSQGRKAASPPEREVYIHRQGEKDKQVRLSALETFLSKGWVRGKTSCKVWEKAGSNFIGKVWIHLETKSKRIPLEELEEHLRNGWLRGRKHPSGGLDT